jgi:hypothetical protein
MEVIDSRCLAVEQTAMLKKAAAEEVVSERFLAQRMA